MPPTQLFDSQSRPIQLGKRLGVGGEGAVFDVAGAPGHVAKVYHKLRPERADKLRAMVAMASAPLQKVAAWPLSTVHERPGGPVVGLVMKKVSGWREIHFLYSVATRRIHFPSADWRFLVGAAYNCAAAFDELHKVGVVIGDVNQSNVFVSDQAAVSFIDCDSFQIRHAGTTYLCEVGVDLFTPPELQGQSFSKVVRTPEHDRFGLAVLIFHLLFMGRHPFSGRYSGQGDMPIDKAIREHRFAYSPGAHALQMAPPPKALTLDGVPGPVADLFVRAFGRNPTGRPAAGEWSNALQAVLNGLRRCPAHGGHVYAASVLFCPWCRLTQQGAPDFFLTVVPVQPRQAGQSFVLATVWAAIEQISRPQFRYSRPAIPVATPRPWPANLPSAVPVKPGRPAVLSQPQLQPPSRIAAPAIRLVPTRPTRLQSLVGGAALGCGAGAAFFLCLALLFVVIGAATSHGESVGGAAAAAFAVLGCVAGIPAAFFGGWWALQESARRKQEAESNEEYHAAQRAYRNEVKAEREEWERHVDAEREKARRWYDSKTAEWERAVRPMKAEADRRRYAHRQAEGAFVDAEKGWHAAADRITRSYDEARADLEKTRGRYQKLDAEYQGERLQLQNRARELQLRDFLDQHLIEDARIEKIGDGRKAVLASFGIETALHVQESAIYGVIPGFGPALTTNLLVWRQSIERAFVFNTAKGVPLHEQQALEQKYRVRRDPLEAALRGGKQQLDEIVSRGQAELRNRQGQIEQCAREFGQTQADLRLIPQGF
jgi:DNA-binding helix-hairpin-helix protein with protein kinase domain